MQKKKLTSISSQIRQSVWSIAVLLVIPVVIGLTMMLTYAQRYQAMIQRMDAAAELKPIVETNLARDLFSVTAGRVSFQESGISEQITQVNETLEHLLAETDGTRQVNLTIARRTMDTMSLYAEQVRDGMEAHRPVSEIESIVDEVWQVGALVDDKIDVFIAEEIAMAAQASNQIRTVLIITAAVECLLLLFALLRTRYVTNRLTASIHEALHSLEETVRRIAQGQFQERVTDMEVAELQDLADQINIMAARLEGQIEEIRQKQEHLAKAELRTLQAQINPHFLYNTLDTIVWQAESGKAEDVITLTRSLSDFFRISLSAGADWIPVEQELRHASAYLSIQKIRYRDILNYEMDVEGDLTDAWIPKLLLQPLVENALYHGIKTRRGGGMIRIAVQRTENRLNFAVEDTGRGMTPEKLAELRAMLQEEPAVQTTYEAEHSGFGLRNVNLRIRLYYRQEEGLRIDADDTGTTVSFDVPVLTKEELEHDQGISG
ncbi:MAG: sensor histidine kinase [Clostridia bacterium]|nr:sensor histidine kinase [Clostridia bacterium]